MKQIRKPDKGRKENWFTRKPGQPAGDPGTGGGKSPMVIKIAVAAVFAAGFLYFLASPGQDSGTDDGPTADQSIIETAETAAGDGARTEPAVSDTGNTRPFHRAPESGMPLSKGYDGDVSGRIALAGPSGGDALLVYVPVGYSARKYARSVQLIPDGLDDSVQGNELLSIGWDNVPMMDKLLESGYADALPKYPAGEFSRYDYAVVDRYRYKSSDEGASEVLVVRQTVVYADKDTDHVDYEYWRVVVAEQASNRAWPVMSLSGDKLRIALNARYPDVPSLARAVFVPADGEPEWDPDSYTDPYADIRPEDDGGMPDDEPESENNVQDVSGISN